MKSTFLLAFLTLITNSFSFGQSIAHYGPFPKISNDVFNFNYLTDSYVLLEKSSHVNTNNGDRKRVSYHTFELQPNATMLSKKMDISYGIKSGVVIQSFLTENYIIELVGFMVVANPNIDIGIIKRDRKTLEMVGEMTILEEKLHFLDHRSTLFETSDGYIFTRKSGDKYVLSYLDDNFNEIKKIPLQEDVFPASFQITKQDEVFLLLVKFDKKNSYSYHFALITPDGDVSYSDPERSIMESFRLRCLELTYLPDLEQVEGVFQFSIAQDMIGYDASKKVEGYKYCRWNMKGEILESKSHIFTVDEVYGEYKDVLLKTYSEKNLSENINSIHALSNIISCADGYYLIINRLTFLAPLQNSFHIVKLDKQGEFQWLKILPSSMKNSVHNFDETTDGNLRILLEDAASTVSNQEHEANIMQKADVKKSALFNILIDKKTGDLLENNLIELNLAPESKIKKIDLNDKLNKYLIESIQNKMHTFSVVSF